MNPKKDKICYNLWLTKEEERILKEILKKGIYSIAWSIIARVNKRGDFEKKQEEKNGQND